MVRKPIGGHLAAAGFAVILASQAHAQTPSPIVPDTRPDQTPPPPANAPAPEPPRPAAALPAIAPFVLREVEIEGASVDRAGLEPAWTPFLGREIGAAELVRITDAVVRRYEATDVALYTVVVPAQTFEGGRLRIRVLEGYVSAVNVTGSGDQAAKSAVAATLAPVVGSRPLTRTLLQRQISLARDLPGARADVQFLTGAADGAVTLAADVHAEKVQIGLSANNRGAAFLGRTQFAADLYLNNLIPGSQTRLTYVTPAETSRFRYIGLTQSQTFSPSGAVLQLNLGHLRTRPKGSDLVGEAESAGLQLTWPLRRSYTEDLYVSAGIDGLDANSAFVGNVFSDDRTRAARLSLLFGTQTPTSRLTMSAAGSVGLDILGARTLSPDLTEIDFTKLSGRLTYARQLAPRVTLRLGAIGQWSDDRLPAGEQFAFGGSEFGRGFESAALIGDRGYAGSAELAYRPPGTTLVRDLEVFGFVDDGQIVRLARAGLAKIDADLSSAGLGVRAALRDRVALQVEATRTLDDSAPGVRADDRVVFSLRTLW